MATAGEAVTMTVETTSSSALAAADVDSGKAKASNATMTVDICIVRSTLLKCDDVFIQVKTQARRQTQVGRRQQRAWKWLTPC